MNWCRYVLICGNQAEEGSEYCRECREAREHGNSIHRSAMEPNDQKLADARRYERRHNHDRRAGETR